MYILELYRSGKQFGYRITARNGQIVSTGHDYYKRKATMLRSIQNLWPDYFWNLNEGVAWVGSPQDIRFRILDTTKTKQF